MKGIEIKWYDRELLRELSPLLEKMEAAAARRIAAAARRRCPVWDGEERQIGPADKSWKARKRGALRDSIRVSKSKYNEGGYLVFAGNYDVFYASFVELGTKSWWAKGYTRKTKHGDQEVGEYMRRPLPEDPFLRKPLERERKMFWQRVRDLFSGGIIT